MKTTNKGLIEDVEAKLKRSDVQLALLKAKIDVLRAKVADIEEKKSAMTVLLRAFGKKNEAESTVTPVPEPPKVNGGGPLPGESYFDQFYRDRR